eukprot:scaffold933_cov56-Phaeocystis_antarctica.AAC.1
MVIGSGASNHLRSNSRVAKSSTPSTPSSPPPTIKDAVAARSWGPISPHGRPSLSSASRRSSAMPSRPNAAAIFSSSAVILCRRPLSRRGTSTVPSPVCSDICFSVKLCQAAASLSGQSCPSEDRSWRGIPCERRSRRSVRG